MEQVLLKIKKLLDLADRSTFEGESINAMMMAQKLMAKHHVDEDDVDALGKKKESIERCVIFRAKRSVWWKSTLAAMIAINFKCVCSKIRSPSRNITELLLIGRKTDVLIAENIYHYAKAEIKHHTDKYMATQLNINALKNTFIRGFLVGIQQQLMDQVNALSLVVVPDQEVVDAAPGKNKKISTTSKMSRNRDAHERGFYAGNECNLRQGKVTS